MFNTQCEEFKNNITEIINKSQLPPVVAYYILKDLLRQVENVCQEVLLQEKEQIKNNQEKEEEVYLDISKYTDQQAIQQSADLVKNLQEEA